MDTVAKFICVKTEQREDGMDVILQPVVDGSEENANFFKFTPWGEIRMGIVNTNVKFEQGAEYYVRFSKAQ